MKGGQKGCEKNTCTRTSLLVRTDWKFARHFSSLNYGSMVELELPSQNYSSILSRVCERPWNTSEYSTSVKI